MVSAGGTAIVSHAIADAPRSAAPGPAGTGNDKFLLTPGPLTTSLAVKQAMLRDWGSRDPAFIALNADIRRRLVAIAGGGDHVCVPVQGSGTFAIEATLGTVVPRQGKLLVLVNGAYGERMVRIMQRLGRAAIALTCSEDETHDLREVQSTLQGDPAITHVAAVHCETTSGILNPIEQIADIVVAAGRALIIDAMSSFGALPLDAPALHAAAVVASSNKCLEGVPGMGYAIIRRDVLEASEGNSPSLALDLFDQWKAMEGNGQWRFTPPTHVMAAFRQALIEHEAEGGTAGRYRRYRLNCDVLVEGMQRLGFKPLLPDGSQAPIIVTFRMPADERFDFKVFYDRLAARGYVIYPGKLTVAPSFRIGCIGQVMPEDMEQAVAVIGEELLAMGVRNCGPAASGATT
ncbi:MAG: 2-aminoethylphosphonate--pyruvate transaminase [Rhizobiales bacterium]|nr:2-aminoethylphosphonate--pyruvate transaminase [Hyphomicrobiales bacterium]